MPGFATSVPTHAHHVGLPMMGNLADVNTAARILVTWVQVEIPVGAFVVADSGSATETASVLVASLSDTDANGTLTESVALKSVSADANGTTNEDVGLKAVTTDANGTLTENVALNFVVADTNAGITEAVAPFAMVVADANGTLTEAVAPFNRVITDANGTLTEAALETYLASSTDADGAITESGVITVPVSSTDANGTLTESATEVVAETTTDTGTDSESTTLAAKPTATDASATTSDAQSLVAKPIATDSNSTTTEAANSPGSAPRRIRVTWVQVTIPTGKWVLTDSGTASQNATTTIKTADTNGATTEANALTANLVPVTRTIKKSAAGLIFLWGDKRATTLSPQLDRGTILPEIATLANTISVDTGTATESASVVVTGVTSSDNGTALLETVGLRLVSTDVNGGIVEVSGRNATSVDTNSGVVETAAFASQFISSDSNTTSGEVMLVVVTSTIADNGTIAETVLTGISTADSGIIDESTIVLVARITAADFNGSVAEVGASNAFTPISTSDSGSIADTTVLAATASTTDTNGSLTESAVAAFSQVSTDNNVSTLENVNLALTVADADNTPAENTLLVATDVDTATITENTRLGLVNIDSATGIDSTSTTKINFVSTDYGFGTETVKVKHPGFHGHIKMTVIPQASMTMVQKPSAYLQMRQIMSDVGSIDVLQCEFRDRNGDLADPTGIDGWVEEADGNVVELIFTKVSLGVWEATYEITKYIPGHDTWWRVQTTGNFQVVGQRRFSKIPQPHAVA